MQADNHPSDFSFDCTCQPVHSSISFADERICGEGASCIVYENRLGGQRVAVKRLREEYRLEPTYRASYRKEFQIGQKLKHDGLPVYRDFMENEDEVCIVMEYVDGVTLQNFLKTDDGRKYFSIADNVRKFFMQLLGIVAYLHRSGVIHCDIKTANILLRRSDRGVMLIDLDKSYSDVLDCTHGGTRWNSDPLPLGDKPTVSKDFEAIGNLLDVIAEAVPSFPIRKFKKLRRECYNVTASDDSLGEALKSRPCFTIGVISLIGTCVFGVLGAYNLSNQAFQMKTGQEMVETVGKIDTVRIDESVPENSPVTVVTATRSSEKETDKKELITPLELDAAMADFIKEVKDALAVLSSDTVSYDWYLDAIGLISTSYSSKIYSVVQRHKSKHQNMPPLEVEYEIMTIAEKSEAKKLLDQFMQHGLQLAVQKVDTTATQIAK